LTETPENNEPTQDEEPAAAPADEVAPAAEEPAATPDVEGGEAATEDPIAEQPSQEAAEVVADVEAPEEPAGESPAAPGGESPAAPAGESPAAPGGESPAAPGGESPAAPAGDEQAGATGEPEAEEELEERPRVKPEIPGADLEVLLPEEEQYLDAEAQAAAEAEAEAAAERARAEAEDEHAKPIADAAIDLAAGARYTATGKRKTAVARVILRPGNGEYSINGKALEVFFPRETLQRMIRQPLETVGYEARMDVVARMHGGGVSAQAGALRHGISRALIVADPNLRGELKRRGYLTRDPRVKERKKAGLKKARKRPQFSKR
jgi:small subunit ribosomal protein S9